MADGNLNWKGNQSFLQLKRLGKKDQTIMENESFRHNDNEIMLAKSKVVIQEANCLKPYLKCPSLLLGSFADYFSRIKVWLVYNIEI